MLKSLVTIRKRLEKTELYTWYLTETHSHSSKLLLLNGKLFTHLLCHWMTHEWKFLFGKSKLYLIMIFYPFWKIDWSSPRNVIQNYCDWPIFFNDLWVIFEDNKNCLVTLTGVLIQLKSNRWHLPPQPIKNAAKIFSSAFFSHELSLKLNFHFFFNFFASD